MRYDVVMLVDVPLTIACCPQTGSGYNGSPAWECGEW
jgi:hypothetical protein